MVTRNFAIVGDVENTSPASYPLNKESAEILLQMTKHPGWNIFLNCLQYEADVYTNAALSTDYGPNALEKFRFNQALAVNIPRIPRAIIESANLTLDDTNTLEAIYDSLYLNE